MNQEKRLEILKALQADNPTPKTELEYHSNFELLIAVVLSAQATDKSVNEATRVLFPLANTPQAVLDLGPEKFTDIIKHIGLCEDLIEHHNGQVPTDFDSLIKLPGVGQKTASVVMNVAFEKPTIAVDTHVFRVANRTGYAKGKTPEIVQKKMERYTPLPYRADAHHWFILLGRYICKARKPECWKCPIEQYCEYKEKNLEPPEPKKSKKRLLPIED